VLLLDAALVFCDEALLASSSIAARRERDGARGRPAPRRISGANYEGRNRLFSWGGFLVQLFGASPFFFDLALSVTLAATTRVVCSYFDA
jgi:hypothetical protein